MAVTAEQFQSVYQFAVELNNEGVESLETAEYEEAIGSFRDALSEYTNIVRQGVQTHHDANTGSNLQWSNYPQRPLHHGATQGAFVYQRALKIEPQTHEMNETIYMEETSAIVYNMGLAHHLLGAETNQSQHYYKALHFYRIAASIREQLVKVKSRIDMIDCSLLNNIGSIHFSFASFDEARTCFNRLSRGLVMMDEQGKLEREVCKPDQYGFILNSTMEAPNLAPAA